MTTILIGANGQLGSELRQVFSDQDLVALTHAALELVDRIQEVRFPIILYRYGTLAKLNLELSERWTH